VIGRRDRAAGVLLGAAVGDALGAAFGGRVDVTSDDLAARERSPEELVHTDATALALVVAEHVAERVSEDGARQLDEDELVRGSCRPGKPSRGGATGWAYHGCSGSCMRACPGRTRRERSRV
jgi:poly(ADP-ribose) glycohydrolase ARH3